MAIIAETGCEPVLQLEVYESEDGKTVNEYKTHIRMFLINEINIRANHEIYNVKPHPMPSFKELKIQEEMDQKIKDRGFFIRNNSMGPEQTGRE